MQIRIYDLRFFYLKISLIYNKLMCFLKPMRVKKVLDKKIILENNLIAYNDKSIGKLKKNDAVLVYGNLVVSKINEK